MVGVLWFEFICIFVRLGLGGLLMVVCGFSLVLSFVGGYFVFLFWVWVVVCVVVSLWFGLCCVV